MSSYGPDSDLNPFEPPTTSISGLAPAPADSSLAAVEFERLAAVLVQTRPWVRLMSVLLFLSCVPIGFLTVFEVLRGFAIGKIPFEQGESFFGNALAHGLMIAMLFFPALYLSRYASRISEFVNTRQLLPLEEALDAQRKYWKLVGLLTCVFAGLMLLGVVLGVMWTTKR